MEKVQTGWSELMRVWGKELILGGYGVFCLCGEFENEVKTVLLEVKLLIEHGGIDTTKNCIVIYSLILLSPLLPPNPSHLYPPTTASTTLLSIQNMIQFYKLPLKKGTITLKQQLHITEQAQLKDAIYNNTLPRIKILSFKNSNIKDDTFSLLTPISHPLPLLQLDLSQNFSFVSDKTVQIITRLSIFPALKKLNLADNMITDQSLIQIARSPSMMHLEQLILYGNSDISGEGLLFLGQSHIIKHLTLLDLHATSIEDQSLVQYFRFENVSKLEHLNLSMNWTRITDKTLYHLAASKHLKNLKTLSLEDCKITDQGVDFLAESQNSSPLQKLNLNNSIKMKNNIITDKSLSSIQLSKYLINLKVLQLRNTDISAKGLRKLSVSLAVQKLQQIRLSNCGKIDDEVLTYLQNITKHLSLRKVYLTNCKLSSEGLKDFQGRNPQINLIF